MATVAKHSSQTKNGDLIYGLRKENPNELFLIYVKKINFDLTSYLFALY